MGAPQAHVTLMMTRIKELGRYLSVRTTRTGQTSPLNFHPNYQDPAESVRWVNLRLLENPAAGMWDKEENDLRRFAAGIISYPGGRVSLLCWMHSAISGLPEHPPEDVRCLLYTSDAADEEDSVDLGGRRIIKKKKK